MLKSGRVTALYEVNFEIHEGEILGVIGTNGSGKTTLFNVITGFLKANGGKVTLFGEGYHEPSHLSDLQDWSPPASFK